MSGTGAADVGTLSVRYGWDPYHERPVESAAELARRELSEYSIVFERGRAECVAALRAGFGAPELVRDQHRYGPFFVLAQARGDRVLLQWHRVEPDWAKPPADEPRRARALEQLAARLRGASPRRSSTRRSRGPPTST